MTKYQIPNLLDELQSDEAYIRNDAIKKIIKGKIDDEHIITALNNVIKNDSYMTVRNFARSALDVFGIEHSAIEESPIIDLKSSDANTSQISKSDAAKMNAPHDQSNKPMPQETIPNPQLEIK